MSRDAAAPARLTRQAALSRYEQERARLGYAEATRRYEGRALRAALPRIGGRSLARVSRQDLERYLAERSSEVRSTSLAREVHALRSFFACLHADGLLARDPSRDLVVRSGPPLPPLLLSTDAIRALLEAALVEQPSRRSPEVRRAVALRDRALLELLYGLGLRASEAARVRLADLDRQDGQVLVRRAKRGRPHQLPLAPASLQAIARYLEQGRPLLWRAGQDADAHLLLSERGRSLRAAYVYSVVRRIGVRIGLEVHPHALRRAVASHFVQGGVSLPVVREFLGHAKLDTTQGYVLVEREALREAIEVLSFVRAPHGPIGAGESESPARVASHVESA